MKRIEYDPEYTGKGHILIRAKWISGEVVSVRVEYAWSLLKELIEAIEQAERDKNETTL